MSKNKKHIENSQYINANITETQNDTTNNNKKDKKKDKKKKKAKKKHKKMSSKTKRKIIVLGVLFVLVSSTVGAMISGLLQYKADLEWEEFMNSEEYQQLLEDDEKSLEDTTEENAEDTTEETCRR